MGIHISVDMEDVLAELDRLAHGPSTADFESELLKGYMETEAHVHVITGKLKGGGHPSSSFGGDRWEGTIAFPRHPGIFELARGNTPTANHPEGEHYFFDPGGEHFTDGVKKVLQEFVEGD